MQSQRDYLAETMSLEQMTQEMLEVWGEPVMEPFGSEDEERAYWESMDAAERYGNYFETLAEEMVAELEDAPF